MKLAKMENQGKKQLIDFYLKFRNDFLSLADFARINNISETDCKMLLDLGKKEHKKQQNKNF